MNENEISAGLAGFESVWQRVAGQGAGENGNELLCRFMQREADCLASAERLAAVGDGLTAGRALLVASGLRRNLRRMQLEYFLQTGDSFTPVRGESSQDGTLTAVRRLYLLSRGLLADYLEAARSDDKLSAVYTANAASHAEFSRALRDMAAKAMS